mgnify:CR=1 FL=1
MAGYPPPGFGYPPQQGGFPPQGYPQQGQQSGYPPAPYGQGSGPPMQGYPQQPGSFGSPGPNPYNSPQPYGNPQVNYSPNPYGPSGQYQGGNPQYGSPQAYGTPQQPGFAPPPNQLGPYDPNNPYAQQNNQYDPNNPQLDDRGFGTALAHGGFLGTISKVIGGVLGNPDGIKEMLKAASAQAVKILGITNGYFSHNVVKILLPPKLSTIASVAKKFRLDSYIEKFIMSMNRAAEQAAASALPIFHRFISMLSINDVASIAGGKGSEATEYFRQQTERDLEQAYVPIVTESMNNWQVTRNFQDIQDHTKMIPGLRHMNVDIHDYTVKKALHGLFWVLGEQESKMRSDPKGQVSNVIGHFFKQ